jgi:hypothetical protein
MHPVANRFVDPLEGLGVDDSDQNLGAIFLGYFSNPAGKKKIIFLQLFWIFIKYLSVSFGP